MRPPTHPMALLYKWRNARLEFIERAESNLDLALYMGWKLLVKDSDIQVETGEQQQD